MISNRCHFKNVGEGALISKECSEDSRMITLHVAHQVKAISAHKRIVFSASYVIFLSAVSNKLLLNAFNLQ